MTGISDEEQLTESSSLSSTGSDVFFDAQSSLEGFPRISVSARSFGDQLNSSNPMCADSNNSNDKNSEMIVEIPETGSSRTTKKDRPMSMPPYKIAKEVPLKTMPPVRPPKGPLPSIPGGLELGEHMLIKNLDTGAVFTLDEVDKIPIGQDPISLQLEKRLPEQEKMKKERKKKKKSGSSKFAINKKKPPRHSSRRRSKSTSSAFYKKNNKKCKDSIEGNREKDKVMELSATAVDADVNIEMVKEGKTRRWSKNTNAELSLRNKEKSKDQEDHEKEMKLIQSFTSSVCIQVFSSKNESHHVGAVWTMRWSPCKNFLASGGHDGILRIWQRRTRRKSWDDSILKSVPLCVFSGHTGDILDLSWARNRFLASSSLDRTVRLWHIERKECVQLFVHEDFVTSVVFSPRNDNLFLSGSLDNHVRVWDIAEKKIIHQSDLREFITCTAFSNDGVTVLAGSFNGKVTFLETEGLWWINQVKIRSSHGKKRSKGMKKIVGIQQLPGSENILVTTTDSRARLYSMNSYSSICKFRGLNNASYQIKATFSEGGRFVISGSEDKNVHVWKTNAAPKEKSGRRNIFGMKRQNLAEGSSFPAHSRPVIVALFVPAMDGPFGGVEGQYMISADTAGEIRIFENPYLRSCDSSDDVSVGILREKYMD